MAVTSTQTRTAASVTNIATGRYLDDGTAAAFTITVGFTPRYVRVLNVPDRTQLEWFQGMAAAEAHKTVAAGTATNITTLGITQGTYSFTVGLDTDVNVSNKQLSWIAIG